MDLCYMDGKFIPLNEAKLPVTDLVIQRGIGVFESIYCYDKKMIAMDLHLRRLVASAEAMRMKLPHSMEEMSQILREGVRRFEGDLCNARIYITGGDVQTVGKGFLNCRIFYLFVNMTPSPEEVYTETGVSLFTLPQERFCPTVKTINYSASYVAREDHPNDAEAIYCPNGQITECTSSSLFLVKGNTITTSPLNRVLAGTTRNILLTLAKEMGVDVEERNPSLDELWQADEAILVNSISLVVPVTSVDGKKIGDGRPGKMAALLLKVFKENMDRFSTQA